MNVLLISLPPTERTYDSSNQFVPTTMPFGLLSIASYIDKYATNVKSVKVMDLQTKSNYEYYMNPTILAEFVKKNQINVVGFSAMFNSGLVYLQEYVEIVKKYNPNAFCFAGGISASNRYKEVLNKVENLDAVCIGEGEIPVLELLENDLDERILHECAAWITTKDLDTKVVSSIYVENLDDIPPIKYEFLNIEEYEARAFNSTALPAFSMHSTRGCPFNCIFCCAANNHGKKIRSMSVERVISDARNIVKKYGANVISFDDDQFLLYQDRAKEILRGLKELGVRVDISSGVSVRYIDEELARLMAECGVREIALAIESGSERMLKEIIDKPLKIAEIKPAVDALRKYNIAVKAFFVIGIPGETPEDREKTVKFIKETGLDWSYIYVAMPLFGSRLYDICKEKDYLRIGDYAEKTWSSVVGLIKAPYIEPGEIEEIAYSMNLEVNFVENYAFRTGNYKEAERQFERVCTRYPKQAFAHYFYARTLEELGRDKELVEKHYDCFNKIISSDKYWYDYAKKFKLI